MGMAPVVDIVSKDLACQKNAKPPALNAVARAGGAVRRTVDGCRRVRDEPAQGERGESWGRSRPARDGPHRPAFRRDR